MRHSILIIDDSRTSRLQVREIIEPTGLFCEFREAADGLEGFKQLLDRPADIILCDLEMPGLDGGKFLQLLAGRQELANLPVIMLTGHEDQEAKVRLLGQGASDYVTKPFNPGELLARVKVQLKIKTLQDSLRESNLRLKELAATDPLTGLANRRTLMSTLEREFRRSQRNGAPLSLLMVDIDHFKQVNDRYGHQQGDAVLTTVAGILRRHLRPYDLAARFGGEEFSLVLPETGLDEAVRVGERIRLAVAGQAFPGPLVDLELTVSLGAAVFPAPGIGSDEDLIRVADHALYQAKDSGRNRLQAAGNGTDSLPVPFAP
ncbi:diguanylate cyclase [Desulfuromonas carbonis]|uniref:diguanylate cyclase n=1 Tax=Desulfuromonas sp. DDH964 TaxID=1823759 RepID=UPI00078BD59E|nr:diguanylate cyclase [Desulfuromonas sp. DDH964]AMV73223.1 response receiver-modulated diguanylate cyclase [Desulfuromonas sp. DDH964]